MTAVVQPPMTYFGGKTRLARRIASFLPPHEHYVEPFAGSLAVLLAKAPTRLETVSDLDGHLVYLDIARTAVQWSLAAPRDRAREPNGRHLGAPREWRIAVPVERPSPGLIAGGCSGNPRR